MNQTAEQVIKTIQRLPPVEQVRVWDWLKEHQPRIDSRISDEKQIEQEIFKRLLDKGLLSEIAPGLTDEEDDEIQPIEISGEPLSEMILRERR